MVPFLNLHVRLSWHTLQKQVNEQVIIVNNISDFGYKMLVLTILSFSGIFTIKPNTNTGSMYQLLVIGLQFESIHIIKLTLQWQGLSNSDLML